MTTAIVGRPKTSHLSYLRYSALVVPEADGTEGFDDVLFTDKAFYGDDIPPSGKSLPATTSIIYEVTRPGTPREIFRGLGENRVRWGSSQVVVFMRHHFDYLSGLGGVFVFEIEGRIIMMRRVGFSHLMLRAPYFSFSKELKLPGGGGMRVFLPLSPK